MKHGEIVINEGCKKYWMPANKTKNALLEQKSKNVEMKYDGKERLTAIERSTAWMKSTFSTTTLFNRPANRAASFTKLARSALHKVQNPQVSFIGKRLGAKQEKTKWKKGSYPVKPVVIDAISLRSTSSPRGSSFLDT